MIYLFLSGAFFGAFIGSMRRRDIDRAVVNFSLCCLWMALEITHWHFFV